MNQCTLYLAKISNQFNLYLCDAEKNTLKKITNKSRRQEFSFFRSKFNNLLKTLQIPFIRYSEKGQPLLKNEFISISNSEGVGVLVRCKFDIGIDIQGHNKNINLALFSKKFNKPFNSHCEFFKYWCKLESLAKFEQTSLFHASELLKVKKYNFYQKVMKVSDKTYSLCICSKNELKVVEKFI